MKFEELTDWIEYNVLKTNGMERVQARVVHGTLQAKDINGVYHNWDLPHNYLKDLDFEETRFNPNEYEPKKYEVYYFANIDSIDLVSYNYWGGTLLDNRIRKYLGIYRTEEEAREKAKSLWCKE